MYFEIFQFDILPEQREDFPHVADENCQAEVREDPGTLGVTWLEDEATPNRFYMVSSYVDQAARDAHHAGRHVSDAQQASERFTFTAKKLGAGALVLAIGAQVLSKPGA